MGDDHAAINALIDEYATTTPYGRDILTSIAMDHPHVEEFQYIMTVKLANPSLSIENIAWVYRTSPHRTTAGETAKPCV